jgi:hypothetical protein
MSTSTTSIYLGIDTCKTIAAAAIPAAYSLLFPVGTPADYEGRFLLLQNWTDGDLWFSDDVLSATGKFPLKAGDKIILDCCSNATYARGLFWPIGASLYVKQLTVPTTGSVYFTIFYGN